MRLRLRGALAMICTVAACLAVSVAAFGQSSTWGSSPAAQADAGAPPQSSVRSTWGNGTGVVVSAPSEAGDAGAPPAASSTHTPPAAAAAEADAGESSEPPLIPPPSDVGFSIGIRGGYSVPIGTANVSSLSDVVQGVAPVGGDAGWFFTPNFYLGVYFLYGFGVNAGVNNDFCSDPDTECSATLYRFGAAARWHFRPKESIDPWVGAGLGYEVLNVIATSDADGSTAAAAALQGIDLNLEAGLDFKPLPYVGFGPYVELTTGQYFNTDSFSPHAWLTFGLRLRTNL